MEQHHFDIILEQLVMIEQNTRKEMEEKEEKEEKGESLYACLNRIRSIFFTRLEPKLSWTNSEIKQIFEESLYSLINRKSAPSTLKDLPWQQ